jgi:predicted CopG family antitoxin
MKSIKVHDDTHRALKRLKSKSRSKSIDQVVREMVKETTGDEVEQFPSEEDDRGATRLDE